MESAHQRDIYKLRGLNVLLSTKIMFYLADVPNSNMLCLCVLHCLRTFKKKGLFSAHQRDIYKLRGLNVLLSTKIMLYLADVPNSNMLCLCVSHCLHTFKKKGLFGDRTPKRHLQVIQFKCFALNKNIV